MRALYATGDGFSKVVGFLNGDFETSLAMSESLFYVDPNLVSTGPRMMYLGSAVETL